MDIPGFLDIKIDDVGFFVKNVNVNGIQRDLPITDVLQLI